MKLRVSEVQTILHLIDQTKDKISTKDVTYAFYKTIIEQIDDESFKKCYKEFLSFICTIYVMSGKNKKEINKRNNIIDKILSANSLLEKTIKELSVELNLSEEWVENKIGEIAQKTQLPVEECIKILKNNLNYQ